MNRTFASLLLGKLGHDVTSVEDGQSALELLGSKRFDYLSKPLDMRELHTVLAQVEQKLAQKS
ncbi:MAG: hypothetical protein ACOCWR_05070 [Oceanidesulfovibrio sp.]